MNNLPVELVGLISTFLDRRSAEKLATTSKSYCSLVQSYRLQPIVAGDKIMIGKKSGTVKKVTKHQIHYIEPGLDKVRRMNKAPRSEWGALDLDCFYTYWLKDGKHTLKCQQHSGRIHEWFPVYWGSTFSRCKYCYAKPNETR